MSKKILTALSVIAALLVVSIPVSADNQRVTMNLETPGVEKTLILPVQADNSPVISLGTAIDPGTNKVVEGYAIIHYAKGGDKGPPSGKGDKGKNQCYAFLSKGAKWKVIEPWLVNTSNNSGLTSNFIFDNLSNDIDKWENAAVYDILGSGSITANILEADTVSPDNLNEVYFGALDPGIIGVTIVWGIFGGPPSGRELVEWDQIYSTYYDWSSSGEPNKMDFENIATHELGHSVGLSDLYDSNCIDETMYGYADYGEINKQTLELGDIAGIKALYK